MIYLDTLKKGPMKLWKTHKALLHDSLRASRIYSPNLKTLNIRKTIDPSLAYRQCTRSFHLSSLTGCSNGLEQNNLLPTEQKGCRRGSYGCNDHLLINQIEEVKSRKKNLSMAWIDYRKALDSIPHSWIEKTLAMYKVCPTITRSIAENMKSCKQPYNSTTPEGQSLPGK